jgi:hypothetical protein
LPDLDRLIPYPEFASPADQTSHLYTDAPPHDDPPRLVREDMLIELTSSRAFAGKTELLYLIIAAAALPRSYNEHALDGKESAVVLIDTEERFDVLRLYELMKRFIKVRCAEISHDELDFIATTALKHVHIFCPASFSSLFDTLDTLPSYLFDAEPPHDSYERPLHSIIINNLAQFYWEVRADNEDREVQALDNPPSTRQPTATSRPRYLLLMDKLKELSQRFECIVIGTTWMLSNTKNENQGVYLHAAFPTLPMVRLETEKASTTTFPPKTSIEGAITHMKERKEPLDIRHKFVIKSQDRTATFSLNDISGHESEP